MAATCWRYVGVAWVDCESEKTCRIVACDCRISAGSRLDVRMNLSVVERSKVGQTDNVVQREEEWTVSHPHSPVSRN